MYGMPRWIVFGKEKGSNPACRDRACYEMCCLGVPNGPHGEFGSVES